MDIGYYISNLLRQEDEVSVPGLGTFMKVRIAGSYDKASNTFRPPSYQISFKATTSDHNSLSRYISGQKQLSVSSAEYFIEEFSSHLSELLSSSGLAEIKSLGTIRKNNEALDFEASENLEIGGIFYGLKPLSDYKSKPDDGGYHAAEETLLVQEEEEKVLLPEDETEEREKRSSLPLIIAIIIPVIIMGAILLYYFNPQVHNAVQQFISDTFPATEQPAAAPAPAADQSVILADSTLNTADTLSGNSDSLASNTNIPAQPLNDQAASSAPADEGLTFEIIGAAFAKKDEAEKYIKQLSSKGIEAKIIENMPGRMIKISLGSFKDESSAQVELIRIQKNLNKEAWIARVKPPQKKP